MSEKMVTIHIDDVSYEVPAGMNLVDAAKFYADNDIPVFCYHPKLAPVGMCRMCLVKQGSIMRDRSTGEVVTDDDGNPQIRWFPKLQTACTATVSEDMVIITNSDEVQAARDDIIEFILTSHPLDCPVCDKGGECPLQNLTMRHGPGESVFHFGDKMHLEKHVPLGELIYLDRERCIQCARCTRFCEELVGDDVLAFHERGRRLQIVTISDPPFDTKFSGNTTDICPVGALTTADFRFGARPWELKEMPSLDPYGPEGTNISLSTRLDRDSGGITVIKRVMPRQNEEVNEIWIADKTRFGHHHTRHEDRLRQPMIRKDGELVEATWDEALQLIAEKFNEVSTVGAIAGPNQSNEDLWELRKLLGQKENAKLGVYPATHTGGDLIQQVGVAKGTNMTQLGKGDVIMVVASDFEEEAPIWWLRTKVASDRGATVINLHPRATKLSRYAKYDLRYNYGDAVGAVTNFVGATINADLTNSDFLSRVDGFDGLSGESARDGWDAAIQAFAQAENAMIFCGAEGVTLEQHRELMQACANLLIITGHVGRPNNGLVGVWPGANIQGAFDLGFTSEATLALFNETPELLFIAGCNPVGEVVDAAGLENAGFVVVTSLFETETTAMADVVLPRQSFAERDGTFTSGERRVQRFYTAQGTIGESLPEWKLFAQINQAISGERPKLSTGAVMLDINKNFEYYAEMSYKNLAQVPRQFPDVGGEDQYYGGTSYKNMGGIGQQPAVGAEAEDARLTVRDVDTRTATLEAITVIPTTVLYDRGDMFRRSVLMVQRIPAAHIRIHSESVADGIEDGDMVEIVAGGQTYTVQVVIDENIPVGVAIMPRRLSDTPDLLVPCALESMEKVLQEEPAAAGD